MDNIFEVVDKTGRKISLSKERWKHITIEHPEISNYNDLINVIENPDKVLESDRDSKVRWYYSYNKKRKLYFKVSVKYLNGEGYVITAHYISKIE